MKIVPALALLASLLLPAPALACGSEEDFVTSAVSRYFAALGTEKKPVNAHVEKLILERKKATARVHVTSDGKSRDAVVDLAKNDYTGWEVVAERPQ